MFAADRTPWGVAGTSQGSAGSHWAVDFTVTLSESGGFSGSAVVSLLTVGLVPGYYVEEKTLNVDLAWRDAARMERSEHLQYQARTYRFFWLPLILAPDVLLPPGWESPKSRNGGFKQMVERLADDIRVRRGGDGGEVPISEVGAVAFPVATLPNGPP